MRDTELMEECGFYWIESTIGGVIVVSESEDKALKKFIERHGEIAIDSKYLGQSLILDD